MFTGQEEDLELLQDLIKLAINDGLQKAKQLSDSKMESVTLAFPSSRFIGLADYE